MGIRSSTYALLSSTSSMPWRLKCCQVKHTVLSPGLQASLETKADTPAASASETALEGNGKPGGKVTKKEEGPHHVLLLKLLADQLGAAPADIVDFELNVCDTQPGTIGGVVPLI